MGRPEIRVSRRKERRSRVGAPHRVNKDDTIAWFDGIILVSHRPFICTSNVDIALRNKHKRFLQLLCFALYDYTYVQSHAFPHKIHSFFYGVCDAGQCQDP